MSENDTKSPPPIVRTHLMVAVQSIGALFLWEGGEFLGAVWLAQLGTVPLAAYGFALPLMLFVWGFAGLLIGAAAAPFIAGADEDDAKRYFVHAVMLIAFLSTIAAIIWYILRAPMLRALGAGDDVMPLLMDFIGLYCLQYPMVAVSTMGPMWLTDRGVVKPIAPHVIIASIIVILGYRVFILGWGPIPSMSLVGLAVAIVVGRVYMFVTFFWVSWREGLWRRPDSGWFGQLGESWMEFARSAGWHGPLKHLLHGSILLIVVRLVSDFGTAAVAVFVAGNRCGVVATIFTHAATMATAPMAAAAWKERNMARFKSVFLASEKLALAGVIIGVAFVLLASPWVVDSFLTEDSAELREMLTIVVIMFPAIWCIQHMAFPGGLVIKTVGNQRKEVALSVFAVALVSGLCVLGSWWAGTLTGLFVGYLVATILYAVVSGVAGRLELRAHGA